MKTCLTTKTQLSFSQELSSHITYCHLQSFFKKKKFSHKPDLAALFAVFVVISYLIHVVFYLSVHLCQAEELLLWLIIADHWLTLACYSIRIAEQRHALRLCEMELQAIFGAWVSGSHFLMLPLFCTLLLFSLALSSNLAPPRLTVVSYLPVYFSFSRLYLPRQHWLGHSWNSVFK